MRQALRLGAIAGLWSALLAAYASSTAANSPTLAEVVAASRASEWRSPEPENTLYLDLANGRVVMELAPALAPLHMANIKTLVRAGYFDGLSVLRLQDNFVAQLGDADDRRSLGEASVTVKPEFTAPLSATASFTTLPDRDGYAPQVGFSSSMPMARDPGAKEQWLIHCYGAVGVARGTDPDSGNGSSLYVVIGHAPRQLDRNLAVIGKVWSGMEWLSALPRGPGVMGFYAEPGQRLTIRRVRIAADVPVAERLPLQILRSDSQSFHTLLEARRNRQDDFYRRPAGFLDICNALVPVRNGP